jgi:hypothetical protein
MVRVFVTGFALVLAFSAFWGNALDAGYLLNPFGILFLLLAILFWFKWSAVCEAFASARDESDIPIIRMGPKIFGGLSRSARQHRRRDRDPSSR